MIYFAENALKTYAKSGNDVDELEADYDLYNSVLMSLVQVGENANLVSETLKEETQDIDWRKHIKNRNFYVHVYGAVNLRRLEQYLNQDVPVLIKRLYAVKNKRKNR
jgi:uncharacterized protein with HEPN domain